MKLSVSAFALTFIGAATAHRFACQPDGAPGYLFGASVNDTSMELYKFTSSKQIDGHHGMVKTDSTSQKFQFYRCSIPFGKYKSGGQIRSAHDPSMCVTPGVVHRFDSDHNVSEYPPDADCRISLQPCAEEHSLELRKQWFASSATSKECVSQISQQGWKSDLPSDAIAMSENGVALGSRGQHGTIHKLYLGPADGFNSECD